MSATENRIPLERAIAIAGGILNIIKPGCVRAEIAGSIRRHKETIGDIEIVCIPQTNIVMGGLFGDMPEQVSALDPILAGTNWHTVKNGPHYKQFVLPDVINLDLFITTPKQWGYNFTIRTGDADFTHWLVTKRNQGGACPSYLNIRDSQVWNGNKTIPTPEERDLFDALQLIYIDPWKRTGKLPEIIVKR